MIGPRAVGQFRSVIQFNFFVLFFGEFGIQNLVPDRVLVFFVSLYRRRKLPNFFAASPAIAAVSFSRHIR